jgi:hypothetical protein
MDLYFARICWNSKGWELPTGEAKNLEKASYTAQTGFGHEEWLFNFTWLISGEHYAFLQPVHKSFARVTGQTIHVFLWAIDAHGQHIHVGEIRNCKVLTNAEAQKAFEDHKRLGWLTIMQSDLAHVRGDLPELAQPGLFNIRFRPEDVDRYDAPYPVAKSTDRIAKFKRYTLVSASESDAKMQETVRVRSGSSVIPEAAPHIRVGSPGGPVNAHHAALQAELMKLLQAQFGKRNVEREAACVDLTVNDMDRRILIEIKPYSSAKQAIRESLGQILEYAFYSSDIQNKNAELFIVAPAIVDATAIAYLEMLRRRFQLPIRYCRFSIGNELPDELRSR